MNYYSPAAPPLPITELDARLREVQQTIAKRGAALPPEQVLSQQVLERLIIENIQLQIGERSGIRITDEELNQAIGTIAQRNGMSLEQFRQALARDVNEEISATARQYPTRFASLATLPMQDVTTAINELEHAVTKLGMKGAELDTHVNGEQWDEPKFLPFFKAAESMGALKSSRQAIVTYGLLAALGMAPSAVLGLALDLFSRKASAVATNVPGPQQPLYMAGCLLREMMFWVPQTGSVGVGISILSYNGRVHFGIIADAKLIPDPDNVIQRFGGEFDKLLYLSLMGSWEHRLDAESAAQLIPAET